MKKIICITLICLTALQLQGKGVKDNDGIKYQARLGYAIGGTAPIGLPATIRSLEKYTPTPSFCVGLNGEYHISGRWGFVTMLNWENKNMDIKARVKNYYMEIVRGDESLAGNFTGYIQTKAEEMMLTVPIMASYKAGENLRLRLGPYASVLLRKVFKGSAYNGYLRKDKPTGTKIELGSDSKTKGSYDFSDDVRSVQYGVDFGADYQFGRKLGMFVDLSWGLTGLFRSGFKTIEQTLYPIFGTIGVTYQLHLKK